MRDKAATAVTAGALGALGAGMVKASELREYAELLRTYGGWGVWLLSLLIAYFAGGWLLRSRDTEIAELRGRVDLLTERLLEVAPRIAVVLERSAERDGELTRTVDALRGALEALGGSLRRSIFAAARSSAAGTGGGASGN